jgi:hypothetical protein
LDLSAWLSIIVVITGGFITYFVTVQIEKQKREYELKKEIYFGVLDAINEVRRKWSTMDHDQQIQIFENRDLFSSLVLNHLKVETFASNKVKRIYGQVLSAFDELKPGDALYNIVYEQLIPAIRNDLMRSRKGWWQF